MLVRINTIRYIDDLLVFEILNVVPQSGVRSMYISIAHIQSSLYLIFGL